MSKMSHIKGLQTLQIIHYKKGPLSPKGKLHKNYTKTSLKHPFYFY